MLTNLSKRPNKAEMIEYWDYSGQHFESNDFTLFETAKLHRNGGPAIKFPSGSECWVVHGKLHRVDGPAKIYAFKRPGTTKLYEWWLNDVNYPSLTEFAKAANLTEEETMVLALTWL